MERGFHGKRPAAKLHVRRRCSGGGGGGSSYDDTEVRELIAAETTRATQQELILTQQLNGTTATANSALSKANTFSEYIDYAESNYATKAEVNSKQNKLVSGTNIKTIINFTNTTIIQKYRSNYPNNNIYFI